MKRVRLLTLWLLQVQTDICVEDGCHSPEMAAPVFETFNEGPVTEVCGFLAKNNQLHITIISITISLQLNRKCLVGTGHPQKQTFQMFSCQDLPFFLQAVSIALYMTDTNGWSQETKSSSLSFLQEIPSFPHYFMVSTWSNFYWQREQKAL